MPPRMFFGNPNRDYVLLRGGDEETAGPPKRPNAARLFSLASGEAWRIALASLWLLVASLAQLANPKLAGDLIDVAIQSASAGGSGMSPEEAREKTNRILLLIAAVTVVGGASGGMRTWLFQSAAERVMFRLRCRLFAAIVAQEIGWFDRVRTGELVNRLAEDTRQIKSAATTSIAMGLRAAVVAVLGTAAMFWTSPLLAACTCAIIPLVALLFNIYGRLSRRYIKEQLAASASATTVAEESLGNMRTVRAFAKEAAATEVYEATQQKTLSFGLRAAALDGFLMPLTSSVSTGAIMAVVWFGARLVIAGGLTAGELSSFVVYAIFVSANAGMLMGVFSSALGASERVFQLLDRAPRVEQRGRLRPAGAAEGTDARLEGVWFAYPSRPGAWVLRDLCLHVAPGQKARPAAGLPVALVGPSGGGKSTIVALLERFYDPQRGKVLLDGVDLPSIDHAFLHQQEPILFADTIAANIAFGLPKGMTSQEAIEAAALMAHAHGFVTAFPQGFDTLVGERGVRLSGGQKQRVAIARAVILQPRLLLLDEATSALDAESEHMVKEALEEASRGRSVLTVAHRLSTVWTADAVAVVESGAVTEQGTHDELLAAGGAYASLVRRQVLAADTASLRGAALTARAALAAPEREGSRDAEGVGVGLQTEGNAAAGGG
eukprot:scaffold13.g339.t1